MVALQEEATNHPKVRRSRAVRAERCGRRRVCERVRYDPMKANESKPQVTCRNASDDIKTELEPLARDEPGGRPTVADRVAQTVVKKYLEPSVEPVFHTDSYGYRLGRSAHDAVGVCRERCWRYDWLIDLDYQAFFDSIDHELMLKAVAVHTKERWILLYVERWLKAPTQQEDGTVVARDRGTPQGSAISPVLANIFLHHAFDAWMAREFPAVPFERYADDVVTHCKSERQARFVLGAIKKRMTSLGLELNSGKTRIVYCKDSNRKGSHEHERFDFLGFTFQPRRASNRRGELFVSFLPAISDDAAKKIRRTIKRWRLHLWSGRTLTDLAGEINPVVRGWINYYGRVRAVQVDRVALGHRQIPGALGETQVQTTANQQQRQESLGLLARRGNTRARPLRPLATGTHPRPNGGSRMTGDSHVRFCESRGLQRPRPLANPKGKGRKRARAMGRKGRGRS